ncbi:U1 small nuclear ribonucleoprotein C-1-like [Arvicola amphibius]|uniref:U1 small nuclear ribonucleoprotein C-1-like n=1 Tax=Arvicola amphibius TaxID=1047088 RepID=UPI001C09B850|nr:U1 small nuclear ribonucleoprotein C-1-like [Arvicola amphibius]XP_041910430.1 U1 small nuclear ribonucleoprotein C-1-like [Arvicola amphibius]
MLLSMNRQESKAEKKDIRSQGNSMLVVKMPASKWPWSVEFSLCLALIHSGPSPGHPAASPSVSLSSLLPLLRPCRPPDSPGRQPHHTAQEAPAGPRTRAGSLPRSGALRHREPRPSSLVGTGPQQNQDLKLSTAAGLLLRRPPPPPTRAQAPAPPTSHRTPSPSEPAGSSGAPRSPSGRLPGHPWLRDFHATDTGCMAAWLHGCEDVFGDGRVGALDLDTLLGADR